MVAVVDLVVDGDGDGDESAAQLGQHRNNPGQEFDGLPVLAFVKAPEGTDDIEHRSAFHGGAASDRVVPSGVGFGASSCGLGDVQRNRERSTWQLITKFAVSSGDLRCHLNGDGHELDGAPIHIQLLKTEHACMSTDAEHSCVRRRRRRRQRNDQVNDHAHVNDHAIRAAVPSK